MSTDAGEDFAKTSTREKDLEILTQLNADYLHSDQYSDIARYEQFLAPIHGIAPRF